MKGGATMKRMKTYLRAARGKLGGCGGESLAETLIALLIAALAILMLANMIVTSSDMIHRSREHFDAYYMQNSILSAQDATTATGTATVALRDGSQPVRLVGGTTSGGSDASVLYYKNAAAPDGTPVLSYKK